MGDRVVGRETRPGTEGSRLPTGQPARAAAVLALYVLAVAVLTLLLATRTGGYALLVIAGTLSLGLTVPFLVLGQRPDAPEATSRASFPVLGTAPGSAAADAARHHPAPHWLAPHDHEQRTQDAQADPAP